MLLEGHQGLVQYKDQIPPVLGNIIKDSLQRIVTLYESWNESEPNANHQSQEEEWRQKLEEFEAGTTQDKNQKQGW
jgi:hypothetical protein